MDTDEKVVVAAAERTGQVGVLDGVEELRFVHVAAQRMGHTIVAQGAYGAVEHEGVEVELHQVLALRQLQDVNTSEHRGTLLLSPSATKGRKFATVAEGW